jgi:hypothetical protein
MRIVRNAVLGLIALPAFAAGVASCTGTTGDALVTFPAYAQGAKDAGEPFTVNGFTIRLTSVKMRIGAVYIDEAPLSGGAEGPTCIDPGVYAAQVPGGVEVDLLSSQPQEFSVLGNGTADLGQSWQIWLTDGDINEANSAHMVDLQGVATRVADGTPFPFAAIVTINANRTIPVSDPSQPGLNPLCEQRIVQIGPIALTPFEGGALYVTVDPRKWFDENLDFSTLPPVSTATSLSDNCPPSADYGDALYCIPDTNFATGLGASQGQVFFLGIRTGGLGAYSVSFTQSR